MAAVLTGARAEIDHVVRGTDRFLVMFNDDHRVAEVAEPREGGQELAVVTLMQADGRLVQYVEDPRQVCPYLRREPDPLALSARERRRAAVQRQVPDADVVQKAEPLLDFTQHAHGDQRLALRELEPLERVERLAERQVHVLGNAAALHANREALRLQPVAVAGGALAQRPVRLEVLLHHPRSVLVPAAQVGNDALEVLAKRIQLPFPRAPAPRGKTLEFLIILLVFVAQDGRGGGSRRAFRRPCRRRRRAQQQQLTMLLRQLGEGHLGIEAEHLRQREDRLAHELPVAAHPGRNRAAEERLRLVRNDEAGIEIVGGPEALAIRAGAVGRVERERPRRHFRHRDAAVHARQPPREELIAPFVGVDDDDVVGQVEGDLQGLREAPLDARLDDQAVDHDVDRVVAPPIQLDVVVEGAELAVDARLREAALAQRQQILLELPLAAADDGREDVDARVLGVEHHEIENAFERLRGDLAPAVVAVRDADVGEEQPQVVVDLGDGADRRAGVGAGGLLLDRDRRREPFDQIDVRLLHLLEKLPRVRRERLDVPALPFGVNRVEGQRRLARAGQAGDHDDPVAGKIDVDVLEVMNAGAAYRNPIVRHTLLPGIPGTTQSFILLWRRVHKTGPALRTKQGGSRFFDVRRPGLAL